MAFFREREAERRARMGKILRKAMERLAVSRGRTAESRLGWRTDRAEYWEGPVEG
jgi:hypothetical protein